MTARSRFFATVSRLEASVYRYGGPTDQTIARLRSGAKQRQKDKVPEVSEASKHRRISQ